MPRPAVRSPASGLVGLLFLASAVASPPPCLAQTGQASNVDTKSGDTQSPDLKPGPQTAPPVPGAQPQVQPRTYRANLNFPAAPTLEVAAGNCKRTQNLKIVVGADFRFSFSYRESSRFSEWRGSVDPFTKVIAVDAGGVVVSEPGNGSQRIEQAASIAGTLDKAVIEFPPCGGGVFEVRN